MCASVCIFVFLLLLLSSSLLWCAGDRCVQRGSLGGDATFAHRRAVCLGQSPWRPKPRGSQTERASPAGRPPRTSPFDRRDGTLSAVVVSFIAGRCRRGCSVHGPAAPANDRDCTIKQNQLKRANHKGINNIHNVFKIYTYFLTL